MKSSEVEFAYPVFGFTPDMDMWSFDGRAELNTCGRDTLARKLQDGMDLIDARGGQWRVLSIRRVGGVGLSLGLSCFLSGVSRIDHELEARSDISLDAFKVRVRGCIEANPDDYEWPGIPVSELLVQVDGMSKISDLSGLIGLDHFRAY